MANCFKCKRYLGDRDEWQKMVTEQGPICYKCFNEAAAKARAKEMLGDNYYGPGGHKVEEKKDKK
jgi:hypothetical protein